MAKNKISTTTDNKKSFSNILHFIEIVIIVSFVGGALFLWQNPQKIINWLNIQQDEKDNTAIEKLEYKIENALLKNNTGNEKIELLNQKFDYFNKSKADASEIINIHNQINSIKNQTSKIAKTSNSGALILTSAMLIRDNVYRGIGCEKEAEVLKVLSENINNTDEDINFIVTHCNMNFVSANTIIDKFNNLYKNIEKKYQPKEETNWKQRLISKINEYIKINSVEEEIIEEKYNELAVLTEIKKLVDNGDLSAAASEIIKEENAELIKNEEINNWYEQTKKQLEFYKSLSNVISNALLVMKVEDAKNITE
ncbi:MAG: hypothetical protein IJZ59_03540 [Alphaproteobacteria bacterium]|nr:hypothetical protein [Alphaproteobacteria bacterium]